MQNGGVHVAWPRAVFFPERRAEGTVKRMKLVFMQQIFNNFVVEVFS